MGSGCSVVVCSMFLLLFLVVIVSFHFWFSCCCSSYRWCLSKMSAVVLSLFFLRYFIFHFIFLLLSHTLSENVLFWKRRGGGNKIGKDLRVKFRGLVISVGVQNPDFLFSICLFFGAVKNTIKSGLRPFFGMMLFTF